MVKKLIAFSILAFLGIGATHIALAQTITGISPTSGARGQTVTVIAPGSGLTGACNIGVSGVGVTYVANSCGVASPSSLSFALTIDANAAPGSRTLTITDEGGLNKQVTFTVAAGEPAPTTIPVPVRTGGEFLALVETIVDWLFAFLLIGAVVYLVLAGWQLISGGGDPQQVSQARQKLIWAALGILVALLSRAFVFALQSIFGV